MKIFTAPQHTRSILPPIHPTKSSLRCVGGIFLYKKIKQGQYTDATDDMLLKLF